MVVAVIMAACEVCVEGLEAVDMPVVHQTLQCTIDGRRRNSPGPAKFINQIVGTARAMVFAQDLKDQRLFCIKTLNFAVGRVQN